MSVIDLAAGTTIEDPYPVFAELRRQGEVLWHPPYNAWLFTSYRVVSEALKDARLSSRRLETLLRSQAPDMSALELKTQLSTTGESLFFSDPPVHTRRRQPLLEALSRKVTRELGEVASAEAQTLVAQLKEMRQWDAVSDFANPLVARVSQRLLGIDEAQNVRVQGFFEADTRFFEGSRKTVQQIEQWTASKRELIEFMTELLSSPVEPPPGLVRWLWTEVRGGALPVADARAIMLDAMLAGRQPFIALLAKGLFHLLSRPSLLLELRGASGPLMQNTVEELLRYDAPNQLTSRQATEACHYAGHRIEVGQLVYLLLGSANRDEAAFERAGELDVHRRFVKPHLSFGYGAHSCLGSFIVRRCAAIIFGHAVEMFGTFAARAPEWGRGSLRAHGPTRVLIEARS
jgi:hypothetical protein